MRYENKHYALRIKPEGILELAIDGAVVCDRGAVHEFLDMSSPVNNDPLGDERRRVQHHIQLYRDAVISREFTKGGETRFTVAGELATSTGTRGMMAFTTVYTARGDSPLIHIEVHREYMETVEFAGDCSICFLSPGGFARSFHMWSAAGVYQARDDTQTAWVKHSSTSEENRPHSTQVPERLKATMPSCGYGVLMGNVIGFGLALRRYTVTGVSVPRKGEMRATRPRPPAERKFDEIEFQWSLGGRREKGDTEGGEFLLAGCRSTKEFEGMIVNHGHTVGK